MKSLEAKLKPKSRFHEFQGMSGWEKVTLNKIAVPVTERAKNSGAQKVLTLSAEHGIISQNEYFGKKIAGENIDRYIKIARNDFVYNDRTTKQFTYGTIKRLSGYESGVVSPIYKCFRFNDSETPIFWEWYFESGMHDAELHKLINEGARTGRFNISIEKFLSTAVWRPNPKEQKKIADCLSSVDDLISAQNKKLDALTSHKKGLMRLLFPIIDTAKE